MSDEISNANVGAFPAVDQPYQKGLTKRELIAAMAMQGMLSDEISTGDAAAVTMANVSVRFADALLKRLKETEGE